MGHMQERPIDVAAFVTRRAEAGLTQEEVAARAGVSLSFIKKVEQGRRQMRFRTAWQVAQVFGCHPYDFMATTVSVSEAA
jgi:transcriptional regulator with XRE-family HTH domain